MSTGLRLYHDDREPTEALYVDGACVHVGRYGQISTTVWDDLGVAREDVTTEAYVLGDDMVWPETMTY